MNGPALFTTMPGAPRRSRTGDEAPAVVRARDVRLEHLGLAALGPDGRGDILGRRRDGAVVHRDAGAGPGKVARDVDAGAVTRRP